MALLAKALTPLLPDDQCLTPNQDGLIEHLSKQAPSAQIDATRFLYHLPHERIALYQITQYDLNATRYHFVYSCPNKSIPMALIRYILAQESR